jgi:hypothetical protein
LAGAYIFAAWKFWVSENNIRKGTMEDTNRKKNADARKDDFRRRIPKGADIGAGVPHKKESERQ